MAERIIHTRLLFWANGMALSASVILIHPSRRDDTALLAHERAHCEQIAEHGVIGFWLRYLNPFSSGFRQRMEVAAYREQLQHRPERLEAYALALSKQYLLSLTVDEARALLTAST
jgi:hypothetical protein